jgi:hypothetical protein
VRRSLALVTLALMAVASRPASASNLDARFGAFFPRAESSLFRDDASLYTVDPKSDFDSFYGGAEFSFKVARNVELGFHVDGFGKGVNTHYRDYTRPNGGEIFQTLHLEEIPIGFSIRIVPTSRHAKVAPFLAVGADLIYWKYREYGDFIDFSDPTLPVSSDSFVSDGVKGGLHGSGGVRFFLNHDFAIVAEGRYLWAPLVTMGGDFAPNGPGLENQIDLSGWSATIGLHIRF